MNFPSLSDAKQEATERTRGRLIEWLPHFQCPKCGELCRAGRKYDPNTAAFHAETNGEVPAWICEKCDSAFYREEKSLSANLWE